MDVEVTKPRAARIKQQPAQSACCLSRGVSLGRLHPTQQDGGRNVGDHGVQDVGGASASLTR